MGARHWLRMRLARPQCLCLWAGGNVFVFLWAGGREGSRSSISSKSSSSSSAGQVSRAEGREVEVKEQEDVEVIKSVDFEDARAGPEMAPRRSPGVGAPQLSREDPVPPPKRAAGARAQLCRLTG